MENLCFSYHWSLTAVPCLLSNIMLILMAWCLNGHVAILHVLFPRKRNWLCQDNIVENVAGAIYMYMVSMEKGVSGSYPNLYPVLWISPNSWVAQRTTHGWIGWIGFFNYDTRPSGQEHPWWKTGLPLIISWLPELFWLIFKRKLFFSYQNNICMFLFIRVPIIENWVAHPATSEVMLDRPAE